MTTVYSTGNPGPRLIIVQLSGGPTHATGNYAGPGARLMAPLNPASLDMSKTLEYGSGGGKDGVENKTMSGGFWTNLPVDEPQDKFPTHSIQLRWADGIRDNGKGGFTPFKTAVSLLKEWNSKLPLQESGPGEKPPTAPWLKCLFQGAEGMFKIYGTLAGLRISITEVRFDGNGYVPKSGTAECDFLEIPALRSADV